MNKFGKIMLAAATLLACACGQTTGNSGSRNDAGTDREISSTAVFAKGDGGVYAYRIPAIIRAADGSLVAFAEARHDSLSDTGDIEIVCRRSTDGGRTWSGIIRVWADSGNVCGNPAPVLDSRTGRLILLATWNRGDDNESAIHARTSIDTRRVYLLHSDDNGQTWSEAEDITSSAKLDEWTWYATGPCHGIQLLKGPHKGRLVVSCNHGVFGDWTRSHVIYSDDGGSSWQIGGSAEAGNESTVAQLKSGDLMLNMRGHTVEIDGSTRMVALSSDGGESFGEVSHDEALVEPVCNASLVNYSPKGKLTGTLLFSNPNDRTGRRYMTVKQSDDSGRTWREAVRLSDLPAAYSDLVVLPGGDVGILYETGENSSYDRIEFSLIPAGYFLR